MFKKEVEQVIITIVCIAAIVFGASLISQAATIIGTNITTAGNIGIGTTTPDAPLSVTASAGSLTGDEFLLQVASTTNSTITSDFIVTADGNVGIGTASPENKLEIAADGQPGGDIMMKTATETNADNKSNIFMHRSRGTIDSPEIVEDGDALGEVDWLGYDGTQYRYGAGIKPWVDGTPGTNDLPTRLVFYVTADGDYHYTERMRINNQGNVGIGTTSPQALLDVFSTATTTIIIDSNAAAKGSCLKLKDVDGGGYTYCYVLNGTMTCSANNCE